MSEIVGDSLIIASTFRFRPNIVFRGAGVPFAEDVIKELVISPNKDSPENGTPINLVSKCTRCLVRSRTNKTFYDSARPTDKRVLHFLASQR